jgi:hypothetical protein
MAATGVHTTMEELLEAVLFVHSVPRLYNEGQLPVRACPRWGLTPRLPVSRNVTSTLSSFQTHVEAGSNTSTIALRIVRGDEKGNLESKTGKYGCESHGTRTREWLRWRGPAAFVNDRPVLLSERPTSTNPQLSDSNKNLVVSRQMGALYQDRLADWPSVVT